MPQGLWQKCPGCAEVVHEIELAENERVCPRCEYHFAQSAKERIAKLLDPDSFVELDAGLASIDTLKFQGMATYKDRLRKYQESTGLVDAVLSGHGLIEGYKVGIAVMDFSFLAATMGSVVGEHITRTIEYARPSARASSSSPPRAVRACTRVCSASCRWRKQRRPRPPRRPETPLHFGPHQSDDRWGDGQFRVVRRRHYCRAQGDGRLCRTTRDQGNDASGFAQGFQTAEFLEEHGLIDLIVHRKTMRAQIANCSPTSPRAIAVGHSDLTPP